jgi:prolyl oligopeptidase
VLKGIIARRGGIMRSFTLPVRTRVFILLIGFASAAILVVVAIIAPIAQRRVYSQPTDVRDPYQWLESESRREQLWATRENRHSLNLLHAWADPSVARRVTELSRVTPLRFDLQIAGNLWVYSRVNPLHGFPELVARRGPRGREWRIGQVQSGAFVGSHWIAPDGRYVAYSTIAMGGDLEQNLTIVDAASDRVTDALIGPIRSVAWDANAGGFLYVNDMFGAVYHHALHTPQSSDPIIFDPPLSAKSISVEQSRSGLHTAIVVKAAPSSDGIVFLRSASGPFKEVAGLADRVKDAHFFGERLLLRSWLNDSTYDLFLVKANGEMARAPFIKNASATSVLISWIALQHEILVVSAINGNSRLQVYSRQGRLVRRIILPAQTQIYSLATNADQKTAIIDYATYRLPSYWWEYREGATQLSDTAIGSEPAGDYSGVIAKDVSVPSIDGSAKIPLTIVYLKSTQHRSTTPTILTAYGAHGDIEGPRFLGSWLAWLESGGVWALAHVRGGGELGESWFRSATFQEKTKSADDLAACAEWLARHSYGDRRHLGLLGNSTGALLVGMALTRNPSLYRSAVGESGVYDLLRSGHGDLPFVDAELGDASNPTERSWRKRNRPIQTSYGASFIQPYFCPMEQMIV